MYRHILIPTDGSELARRAVQHGLSLAKSVGSKVTAFRSATVSAITRTSLLVLDAHDLHVLMEREPRIAQRIREVARTRLGEDAVTRKGDLVVEELEDAETIHRSAASHGRS